MMSELLALKRQIKEWEHDFQKINGRVASKADIKKEPATYDMYKRYKEAKAWSKPATNATNESAYRSPLHDNANTAHKTNVFDDNSGELLAEGAADSAFMKFASNTELGPTPQANGKVLSIFDMKLVSMTPPESSPLKAKGFRRQNRQNPDSLLLELLRLAPPTGDAPMHILGAEDDAFKTPTKNRIRRLELLAITPSKQTSSSKPTPSLLEKLTNSANVLVVSADNLVTPSYISKHNKSFNFSEMELTSPTKKRKERGTESKSPVAFKLPSLPHKNEIPVLSPVRRNQAPHSEREASLSIPVFNLQNTPQKKETSPFQVSPSPLKVHRFLSFGENKMSTLFKDYQMIKQDLAKEKPQQVEGEEVVEDGEAENGDENAPTRKRKKLTQKRTTRNWKMKPRTDLSAETDSFEGKNIHTIINQMNEEEEADMLEGSQSDESAYDSDEELQKQKEREFADIASQKGKAKPTLSMNYQRSKINDPRAKAFKRRMRR